MLKRLNQIANITIGSFIGVFIIFRDNRSVCGKRCEASVEPSGYLGDKEVGIIYRACFVWVDDLHPIPVREIGQQDEEDGADAQAHWGLRFNADTQSEVFEQLPYPV